MNDDRCRIVDRASNLSNLLVEFSIHLTVVGLTSRKECAFDESALAFD